MKKKNLLTCIACGLRFLILFSLFIVLLFSHHAVIAAPVQSTSISIEFSDAALHEKVQERIKESVQKVAEKVIANRDVEEIKTISASLEKVLQKIFNQVLTGFNVTEVHITPGADTKISVKLSTSAEVVESVKVKIELGNIHPDWQPLLNKKIEEISPQILPILSGIPVSASDWAPYIVRPVIEALIFVNVFFPGFSVDVDMSFGKETIVTLKLKPQEPIIRSVSVSMTSKTLPNVYLKIAKYIVSSKAGMLVGLPVEFLKAHQVYLQNHVNGIFQNRRHTSTMVATVNIVPGEDTRIRITLDSKKYEGIIEGYLGFSTPDKNPEFRVKFLAKFSKNDYLMVRALLFPSPLTLEPQAGIGRKFAKELELSALWDFKKQKAFAYSKYESKKIHAEFIPQLSGNFYEMSVGYKIKSPLRIEIVRRQNENNLDNWVRLVTRF